MLLSNNLVIVIIVLLLILKILMNVAVMFVAMGLVSTCWAPSLVSALLAILSTLMSDNVLVRINATPFC